MGDANSAYTLADAPMSAWTSNDQHSGNDDMLDHSKLQAGDCDRQCVAEFASPINRMSGNLCLTASTTLMSHPGLILILSAGNPLLVLSQSFQITVPHYLESRSIPTEDFVSNPAKMFPQWNP